MSCWSGAKHPEEGWIFIFEPFCTWANAWQREKEREMDCNSIDWNIMSQEQLSDNDDIDETSRPEYWDKRADGYNKRFNDEADAATQDTDEYVGKILDHIEVKPEWSVLDIGCGAGKLTLPLAQKAKSVTALDFSAGMLNYLETNAGKRGINNIKYINSSWQDAFAGRQVSQHDVVIASRSLSFSGMENTLAFIITVARKAAYLTFPVAPNTFNCEFYKEIGKIEIKTSSYIYILNILFQMKIYASVEILRSKMRFQYASLADAVKDFQLKSDPFTEDEQRKLREYLKNRLVENKSGTCFTREVISKWALIWWKTDDRLNES